MKKLILMVGYPRSGKSLRANLLSKDLKAPVVSSDAVRNAIHGTPMIPELEPKVWQTVNYMIGALFEYHDIVIMDSCNMTEWAREQFLNDNWEVCYYRVETPVNICINRAIQRGQTELVEFIKRLELVASPLTYDELERIFVPSIKVKLIEKWLKFSNTLADKLYNNN